jgi:hypothetical protein
MLETPRDAADTSTYGEEVAEKQALLAGLDRALDDVLEERNRSLTRLEQEKCCYWAIRDLDAPLTYSWYLAGAVTAADTTMAPGSQQAAQPEQPSSPTQEYGDLRADTEPTVKVQEYRDFFRSATFFDEYTLERIWWTNRYEFLYDFYTEFAPEEYRALYLHSTELRQKLRNIDEVLSETSRSASLADFGAGRDQTALARADEEQFRLLVSKLHMELAQFDALTDVRQLVTRGTDIIEHVLATLATTEALTPAQREIVHDLSEFYFHYIWKYPALYISAQTADGPAEHGRQRKQAHLRQFSRFNTTVESEIEHMVTRCEDANLLPDPGTHTALEDGDAITDLHTLSRELLDADE